MPEIPTDVIAGDEICKCGHRADDHLFWSSDDGALQGGIVTCPADGCECYATWSVGENLIANPDAFKAFKSAFEKVEGSPSEHEKRKRE